MNETFKRKYLWIAAVLVVLLAAVLIWPSHKALQQQPVAVAESDAPATESAGDSQPRDSYSKPAAQAYPQRDSIDWQRVYADAKPYRSKYDNFSVELNTADTTDLKQLRGIGSAFARRIVKYRDLLGGYQCKEQLREVYGMTDTLYSMIAGHVVVDPARVTKIDLNSISLDSLKRHPYFDYYQAKAVVRYREQQGSFRSKDELRNIALIDQETFKKIENYIILL